MSGMSSGSVVKVLEKNRKWARAFINNHTVEFCRGKDAAGYCPIWWKVTTDNFQVLADPSCEFRVVANY